MIHIQPHIVYVLAVLFAGIGVYVACFYRYRKMAREKEKAESGRGSGDYYSTILDAIDEGIIVADSRGVIREINPTAAQMTGYRNQEAIGRSLGTVFFVVSYQTQTRRKNPLVLVKKEKHTVEYPDNSVLISRDGSECPIAVTASPLFNNNQTLNGVVVVIRDITHERHRMLALLESAQEKAHILYSISSEGIIYFDTNLRILWANVAAAQFAATTPEELIGEYCYRIYPHKDKICEDCPVARCIKTGSYEEQQMQTNDGRVWLVRGNPVRDDSGNVVGAVENVLDITERYKNEEALRRSTQKYQTLFEHTGTAAAVLKEDTTIEIINSEFVRVCGYSKEEVEGRMKWTEFVAPYDLERMVRNHRLRRLHSSHVPNTYGFDFISRSGELHHMLISVEMIPDTTDSICSMIDISERRNSRRRIEHVNRMLHAIRAINQAISRERHIEKLVQLVCTTLASYGGSQACWIVLFRQDEAIRTCGCEGVSSHDFGGFCARMERGELPSCVADALHNKKFAERDALEANAHGCPLPIKVEDNTRLISVRLCYGDITYGVMGLYVASHYAKDEEYRTLVEELSEDISLGFHDIELEMQREKTEKQLHESRGRLSAVFHAAQDVALILTDGNMDDPKVIEFNPGAEKIFGYQRGEMMGNAVSTLHTADDVAQFREVLSRMMHAERGFSGEHTMVRKTGEKFVALLTTYPIFDDSNAVMQSMLYVAIDISGQKEMEQRLRQSEKMEAIGQLAGGIAHDFNNQLGGIMGFADLLKNRMKNDEKSVSYAEKILSGVRSAADLTQKLLAFARKGKYQEVPVDIHTILQEVKDLLERSIDRRIRIVIDLRASESVVKGDASQLQNALLNMGLNARDAMTDGGTLTYSTEKVVLDRDFFSNRFYSLTHGEYMQIKVRDTGSGMSEEVQQRIFEPFFTTKERGKGTGMGLAAVYGTVKNHLGAIELESGKGEGSCFTIYLPLDKTGVNVSQEEIQQGVVAGSGHVLLVDDEEVIRKLGEEMLTTMGYSVHTVSNGREAVEYYRHHRENVDMVILDVVMPVMGGRETLQELKKIDPDVSVLLASGYSVESEAVQIHEQGVKGFIQKPFTASLLSGKIAEIISRK